LNIGKNELWAAHFSQLSAGIIGVYAKKIKDLLGMFILLHLFMSLATLTVIPVDRHDMLHYQIYLFDCRFARLPSSDWLDANVPLLDCRADAFFQRHIDKQRVTERFDPFRCF